MAKRYNYWLPEHPVEAEVLQVGDLWVDAQAQRILNERRCQYMAENFVPEAVGTVVVSRRQNGKTYVVDGMHRARVLQLKGIMTVMAEVHYDLDQTQEAMLFLLKNRESKGVQPADEYKIGLTGKIPLFVDTDKVVQAHGLMVGSSSANSIGAIQGILRITDDYGPEVLDRALTVAEDAWGRTTDTWNGMIISGLGLFLGRHGALVVDKELASKLAKAGNAGQWMGRVHARSTDSGTKFSGTSNRTLTSYHMILAEWNKGKSKNKIVV
jgi:hypothetical protein